MTGAQLTGEHGVIEAPSGLSSGKAPTASRAFGRRWPRLLVRSIGLLYLALLLALPVGLIFVRTFADGLEPVLERAPLAGFPARLLADRHADRDRRADQHGLRRHHRAHAGPAPFPRPRFAERADRPSVRALAGRHRPVAAARLRANGLLGGWLKETGFQVIFAMPGMVLATVFVSLPFVVREVMPVLREIGTDQEEAAYTLGASQLRTFWRVTLPSIRWGVIYGVVLTTARSLGEFGAVSVVSGRSRARPRR